MPVNDPEILDLIADQWNPAATSVVDVMVNILKEDVPYFQTYRLAGNDPPDNLPIPDDPDFEGIIIFNRRDRIAGVEVFTGGLEFKATSAIDIYIYPRGGEGKVRVDNLGDSAGGAAEWGGITGTLGDQTDLQNVLDNKETVFSKNTAFNKNFGSGAGTVAEGSELAAKMTGPGSSQINEIFIAVDEFGNARTVPVKIDPVTRKVTLVGVTEQDGDLYIKQGEEIFFTVDGTDATAKGGGVRGTDNALFLKIGTANKVQVSANVVTFQEKIDINDTFESTDITNGSFHTDGGAGIEKNTNIGGDLGVVGDINTSAWSDHGGDSTIVGFSSAPIKAIWYKKVGNLVFVNYEIVGTSNAPDFTFTLPFTSSNSSDYVIRAPARVTDAGVTLATPGLALLSLNSSLVTLLTDWASTQWTASGGKAAEGQFWYEAL